MVDSINNDTKKKKKKKRERERECQILPANSIEVQVFQPISQLINQSVSYEVDDLAMTQQDSK